MNRRGQSFEIVYFVVKVFAILGVSIALGAAIHYFFQVSVDTAELRTELFLQRLLNGPNGMVYIDNAGIPWPGTVDLDKFTTAQLEASMQPASGNWDWIAAEISLMGKIIHYNPEGYRQWQMLRAVRSERQLPVIVNGEEQILTVRMIALRG